MYVIGTEQGYLDTAVDITATGLTIATGERYDVVVDFRGFGGKNLILANDAPAPFPAGKKVNPNYDGTIMQFRVVASLVQPPVTKSTPIVAGTQIRATLSPVRNTKNLPRTLKRRLTLNEVIGKGGPLEMLVNNTKYATQGTGDPGNPITELPKVGAVEEWEIINLTADTHPMHPHLVSFQLIDRTPFNVAGYNLVYNAAFLPSNICLGGIYCPGAGPPFPYNSPIAGAVGGNPDVTPFLLGPAVPAAGMELGWKDTVRMNPGEVTRILVQFTNQEGGAYSFDATSGPGYVFHCHIVDHEDNEMMRPFKVVP
jgi:FtsP/CotA-like multicopper oxidase with cupredoxin domain